MSAEPATPSPRDIASWWLRAVIVRRERWTLTVTDQLLALSVVIAITPVGGRHLCRFLAVSDPVNGQLLVVERWIPAYAYRAAVAAFRAGHYEKLVVAGAEDEDLDDADTIQRMSPADRLHALGVPDSQ